MGLRVFVLVRRKGAHRCDSLAGTPAQRETHTRARVCVCVCVYACVRALLVAGTVEVNTNAEALAERTSIAEWRRLGSVGPWML